MLNGLFGGTPDSKPTVPPTPRGNSAELTAPDRKSTTVYNYEKVGRLTDVFKKGLVDAIAGELNETDRRANLPQISRAILTLRAHDVPADEEYNNKKALEAAEKEKDAIFQMAMENEAFRLISLELYQKMDNDAQARVPKKTDDARIPGLIFGKGEHTAEHFGAGLAYTTLVMSAYVVPPNELAVTILADIKAGNMDQANQHFAEFMKLEILGRIDELPKEETRMQTTAEGPANNPLMILTRSTAKAFTGRGNALMHNTRVTLNTLKKIKSKAKFAVDDDEKTEPDPAAVAAEPTAAPTPDIPPGKRPDTDAPPTPETETAEAESKKRTDRRFLKYGAAVAMTLAGAVGAYFAARGVNEVIEHRQGEENAKNTKETWIRRAGVGATILAIAGATYLSYRNLVSIMGANEQEAEDDKENGTSKSVFATLGSLGLAWAINQAYQRFGKKGEAGADGTEEVNENSPQWWQYVQQMYERFFQTTVETANATEETEARGQSRILDTMDDAIGFLNRVEKLAQQIESDIRRGGDLFAGWIGRDRVDAIQLNVIPILSQVNFTTEAIEASLRRSRELGDLVDQIFGQGRPIVPAMVEYLTDIFLGNAYNDAKEKLEKEIKERAKAEKKNPNPKNQGRRKTPKVRVRNRSN